MSAGTDIIDETLMELGVSSAVKPAPAESILKVMNKLNGMIARWEDDRILMGCVPLKAPGEELSEPLGARNAIIALLAVECDGMFPNAQLKASTVKNARVGMQYITRTWQDIEIPAPVARSTYPKGAGNYRRFYNIGEEVDDNAGS